MPLFLYLLSETVMGVDLRLLIVESEMPNNQYAHTLLEFQSRDYELYDRLNAVSRTMPQFNLHSWCARIPDGQWKGESGYGVVNETPYGEPLAYVTAEEFMVCVGDGVEYKNHRTNACIAYTKQLPPKTLIALYYH